MILLKSPEEIALMHKASMIVAEILEELAAAVKPGITTEELDRLAEELTYRKGCAAGVQGIQAARRGLSQDLVRVGKRRNRPRHSVRAAA